VRVVDGAPRVSEWTSFVDQEGWPVNTAKLPSWEQKSDRLYRDDAIFHFFACPCSRMPGGNRRPHRMSVCPWMQSQRGAGDDPDVAKRLRAATTPLTL
jgi:hypothetical protein